MTRVVSVKRRRVRFWLARLRWRLQYSVCWLVGHRAPNGECYRCGMLVDEDQIS